MKRFWKTSFVTAMLAAWCWCDKTNAKAETLPPLSTQSSESTTEDDRLEAVSQFEAIVVFEGDADFTMTTAHLDGRQVLLEQSKYRRDGSLQSEIDYFYNANGALAQSTKIEFDTQSRLIEYSIRDAQGKVINSIVTEPSKTKLPMTTSVLPFNVKIEAMADNGDGTKVVWKLRADRRLESKSIKRAANEKLGAIHFVSQYDNRGLRREMSAFLRNGSRRSHVFFVRNAQNKLAEVQYAGAQNGTRYTYDQNGRLKETRFLEDGIVKRRFEMRSTPNGKIGEMLFYDAQGLTSRETLTCDAKDRLVSASVFDGKNVLQQKTTFKYNAQGNQIEREVRDATGRFLRSEKSEYQNGKLLKVIYTAADGTTVIDNYDDKGSLIKSAK